MTTPSLPDPTFRSYTSAEAKTYATHRLSYSQSLYSAVIQHHASTGGQFDLLLDVGCGPGNATRDVALEFERAVGADPGEQMIEAAREIGGTTKSGEDIRFVVQGAEEIAGTEGLQEVNGEGKVDLLIAAMAAHWFEMDKFWTEAAKVVKPGGTVALWTLSSSFCHPSTLNYPKVMQILLQLERETLAPYTLPGNLISMNMYDDLPLPWSLSPTSPAFSAFPKSSFTKHEYDREGVLSNGTTFFSGGEIESLDDIEGGLGTASMVMRWRAVNPEFVGTERDVVKMFVKELRAALGGQESLERGSGTAILLFKRV